MLPREKEPKIMVCFSCFLTLAVLPHGGSSLWWEHRNDGSSKEVLTVKASHYLPFPTRKGCLRLCYMACPERHGVDIEAWALGCCGAQDKGAVAPYISWSPENPSRAPVINCYAPDSPWMFIKAKSFLWILSYMTSTNPEPPSRHLQLPLMIERGMLASNSGKPHKPQQVL